MKWLVVLIAIVAVSGGIFAVTKSNDDNMSESKDKNIDSSIVSKTESNSEKSTINKLFDGGANQECTYDNTDASGNRNSGKFYFASGKMLGDFTTTQSDGTTNQSNILLLDKMQYIWENGKNEGFKVDLSNINNPEIEDTNQENQNTEYDFSCKPWSVEQSMFEVPSEVNFVDNSVFLQNLNDQLQNVGEVCNSIQGPTEKSACEQALTQ